MAAWGRSRQQHQHRQLLQQDDLGDTDIMAYSAMNAGGDDDDTVFSSGGAIMDALEQKAPGTKNKIIAESKPKPSSSLKKAKPSIDGLALPDKMNLPELTETYQENTPVATPSKGI